MTQSTPQPKSHEQEAAEALAEATIKAPKRKNEFEKHAKEWVVAYKFYREQGIAQHQIESHLRGIDFNSPVKVGYIPPPAKLMQYQPPTTEGEFPKAATGNYWSLPGQSPQQLGISDYGKLRDPKKPWAAAAEAGNVKKTPWLFEIKSDSKSEAEMKTPALFSTAAAVTDDWSRRESWEPGARVVPVICAGGGQQIFAPKGKQVLTLQPDQKPVQEYAPEGKAAQRFTDDMRPK